VYPDDYEDEGLASPTPPFSPIDRPIAIKSTVDSTTTTTAAPAVAAAAAPAAAATAAAAAATDGNVYGC
jgi:hypothetical protein